MITRIAYAVGLISRSGSKHTLTTCRLITYLMLNGHGTVSKGIKFSGSMFDMNIFTDADWAGDIYVMFTAGGPLMWKSKWQTTVLTSSMRSKCQALYAAMQNIV